MDPANLLIKIAVLAIPMVFAITLHEAAHGYVARYFGDNTAWMLGRVTLNPLKHIDPLGTVVFPLLTAFSSGLVFGWAKPVPVNFANLRNPKADMLWVAAAGPFSNALQAFAWGFIAKLIMVSGSASIAADFWYAIAIEGIRWNVAIAIFNLFPLLPLDGGRMVASLLPNRAALAYSRLEPYGMIILIGFIVLLMTLPPLGQGFNAVMRGTGELIYSLFGLQ